jgi:ubiquinone/menaquinone biosynthesis C-methylase UbiE
MKKYRAIAEYYDAENVHQEMLRRDVPLLLGHLPRRRQNILELAVGTGRAAIPLAQAGHRVVGVDYARDMLEIARRKRDGVGIPERDLSLIYADVLRMNLREKFDWVILLFNTFLIFLTLAEQDTLLQAVVRHLKPRGKFWVDIFQPNLDLLAEAESKDLDPVLFHVPELNRTVYRTTSVERNPATQIQNVKFHYRWFDDRGTEHRQRVEFALTFFFPRELRLLLERNGMVIEKLYGDHKRGRLNANSPRMIALCRRR